MAEIPYRAPPPDWPAMPIATNSFPRLARYFAVGVCAIFAAGVAGIVAYIASALVLESFGVPKHEPGDQFRSYGQMFGIIMAPLAGVYGLTFGAFAFLCWMNRPAVAALQLLIATLVTGGTVLWLWQSDLSAYGYDAAYVVLYVPFVVPIATALLLSVCALSYSGYLHLQKSKPQ